jgi:hypothetical protein
MCIYILTLSSEMERHRRVKLPEFVERERVPEERVLSCGTEEMSVRGRRRWQAG